VSIRAATEADGPAIRSFAERLAEFRLPAWRTATEIADADAAAMIEAVRAGRSDNEVWIAERERTPVGCLHVLATTDFFGRRHAHVSVLATTQAAEGTGVARALMAYAEEWARQRGFTLLTLNVFAANARARRLYDRCGFEQEAIKYAKPL
jgi:GNAT superfamily N-acetyltransferase